ncbi:MAG TPA: PQQ-binding-like beta-propeller repeat protein [Acidimicrobiales bacterium]|nr:PQQ-binding-like beta-propeller repeat protein [Acidimicrobiales bacterium]
MPDERRRRLTLLGLAIVSVLALAVSFAVDSRGGSDERADGDRISTGDPVDADDEGGDGEDEGEGEPEGEFFRTDFEGWADPAGFGKPYPNAAVEGLLTFRGNPSRSYYGAGPVPRTTPEILHRFPDEPMCRSSVNLGETKVWCGMGWTGQPTIIEREDRTWAIFGGYDGHIHFMDAETGERILPDVETGDIIKGTPTIDPDGYPLVYTGSRDDLLRVIAFDRPGQAEVLWTVHAESVQPVIWNDDWDASPIVIGDYLVENSESGRFWVIKLNRTTDDAGLVQVDPEVVFTTPVWDQEALDLNGDKVASAESSPAIYEDTAYLGTSAGLIWGFDLSGLDEGRTPEPVFRFWSGNDHDATVVVDDEGMLYIAGQYDRPLERAREVGQVTKLDPSKPDDPIVWKIDDHGALSGGVYGTPGIYGDVLYFGTNAGRLVGVDRMTGQVLWEKRLHPPVWGSPVIVDDVLLIGDCGGTFHAFDVSDPRVEPPVLWQVELGGCIEATPAVWKGRIYIGTRAGHLYVLGDPSAPASTTSTTAADDG